MAPPGLAGEAKKGNRLSMWNVCWSETYPTVGVSTSWAELSCYLLEGALDTHTGDTWHSSMLACHSRWGLHSNQGCCEDEGSFLVLLPNYEVGGRPSTGWRVGRKAHVVAQAN